MDTQGMYERGVADAGQGEPHPFYYQHYYHYRRGYDAARRRLRRPGVRYTRPFGRSPWLMGLVVVAISVAGYIFLRPEPPSTEPQPARAATIPTRTPLPVRTQIFETATPSPTSTPEPAGLGVGNQALVTTDGLRARREPGLNAPVALTFRKGDQVAIVDGPHDADGFVWWQIEGPRGTGWSAERSTEGVTWLEPVEAMPEE